jgi:D-alanyl-D-alanine carboxypeptidase
MALRRKDKKVRKLNKTSFRRPASGRTAELFDLRETDDNSGASRNTDTYSGRQTGAGTYTGPDSRTSPYSRQNDSYQYSSYQNGSYQNGNEIQRPYRERHRVEVNRQDSYAYGQNGRTERYGSGAAAADDGQRYGNRVVHGNAPGSRTGRNDASVQREIEQDLIYDRRSNRGSSTDRYSRTGRAGGYSRTGSAGGYSRTGSTDRYSRTGSTGGYSRTGDADGYSRTGSTGGYSRTGGADRYNRGGTYSSYNRKGEETASFDDLHNEAPDYDTYDDLSAYDRAEYDGYYDEREYSDGEESDNREAAGRRMRQRAQSRREREKQLRGLYLKTGMAAAAAILLLIIIVPRVISATRPAKAEEQAAQSGTFAAAQEESGTEQPDADDSAAQAGLDTETESDQTAPAADQSEAVAEQAENVTDQPGTGAEETESAAETPAAGEQDQTAAGQETPAGAAQPQEGTAQSETPSEAEGTASPAVTGADLQTAAASGRYRGQEDWRFILVNPWYILPEEYNEVVTSSLPNGESVDSRCYADLMQMLADCTSAGGNPVVCSSYRPHMKQVALFDQQVESLVSAGRTREEAEAEAGTVVALPGTSEHEIGLAVDICDYDYQNLDDAQADTPTQKWLMEHSWEYGFILRYPVNKSNITGIIYEPWHYRYVGKEAAREITEKGICLEEYLEF